MLYHCTCRKSFKATTSAKCNMRWRPVLAYKRKSKELVIRAHYSKASGSTEKCNTTAHIPKQLLLSKKLRKHLAMRQTSLNYRRCARQPTLRKYFEVFFYFSYTIIILTFCCCWHFIAHYRVFAFVASFCFFRLLCVCAYVLANWHASTLRLIAALTDTLLVYSSDKCICMYVSWCVDEAWNLSRQR